jgi:hypothetical protein
MLNNFSQEYYNCALCQEVQHQISSYKPHNFLHSQHTEEVKLRLGQCIANFSSGKEKKTFIRPSTCKTSNSNSAGRQPYDFIQMTGKSNNFQLPTNYKKYGIYALIF